MRRAIRGCLAALVTRQALPREALTIYGPTTSPRKYGPGSLVQALAQPASYGTQGVPYDPSVHFPGSRWGGALWADDNGSLWLFGGIIGDLWKIDIVSRKVTWVSGSPVSNAAGSYGTISVPATTNLPWARESFAHWMDSKGN